MHSCKQRFLYSGLHFCLATECHNHSTCRKLARSSCMLAATCVLWFVVFGPLLQCPRGGATTSRAGLWNFNQLHNRIIIMLTLQRAPCMAMSQGALIEIPHSCTWCCRASSAPMQSSVTWSDVMWPHKPVSHWQPLPLTTTAIDNHCHWQSLRFSR